MKRMLGGEIIAAMLAKEGVDRVFGIVDGTYLGFYASFAKYGIELVSPRHETSAAHMAAAYARLTGKLGVCMASNGPGVANILPGVAVENAEGNRVLLITSCRRQGIAYPDRGGTYQYFDQVGVTGKMSKLSVAVPTADRIPELMRRAFRASYHGRPGVVHVDVPENVMNGVFEVDDEALREPSTYRRVEPSAPSAEVVARIADRLLAAERPLIHAGSGVVHAGAFAELARVAALLEAPVSTSWAARGVLDERDAHALPTWAMSAIDEARKSADLMLVLGSRIGETDWWGRGQRWARASELCTIQVDLDEEMLGMNRPIDLGVVADCGALLRALARELEGRELSPAQRSARKERLGKLAELRQSARRELDAMLLDKSAPMGSAHVPHALREALPDDAVLVVDGGNTAVWSQFFHELRSPNTLLSTFKLGMLGAGVAQAVGAKVARPDRAVACILGDGAMGFHLQEIETAVRHRLPVLFVVLCDRQWGMVKLTQQVGLGAMREVLGVADQGTINTDFSPIAFDEVARAMGALGERVRAPAELAPAIQRALASGQVAVLHVEVDPMAHLFAPGLMAFKEMHQEPVG
jgi:acetolactate synthase-1/2/3 large subunit